MDFSKKTLNGSFVSSAEYMPNITYQGKKLSAYYIQPWCVFINPYVYSIS